MVPGPSGVRYATVRRSIDGAGHVASDEAGAEPVGVALGRDDLPQLEAGELARRAAEPVQAKAAVEVRREQLRGHLGPFRDGRPRAVGVVPDLVVLRAGHGDNNLFGAPRRLRRGGVSFTIDRPGLRSSVHLRLLSCGKKKDDEETAGRIPGTSIP